MKRLAIPFIGILIVALLLAFINGSAPAHAIAVMFILANIFTFITAVFAYNSVKDIYDKNAKIEWLGIFYCKWEKPDCQNDVIETNHSPIQNKDLFGQRMRELDSIFERAEHGIPNVYDESGQVIPLKQHIPDNGYEYEQYCAGLLRYHGYYGVDVTPSSGDFGADIVCYDSKSEKCVFQCKMYGTKVGNTPVQEVVAAKAHYNASRAGVITTIGLTDAAMQLAKENNVIVYVTGE